jgi:hypothetical protein
MTDVRITVTPSTLEEVDHWDEWERVIADLDAAGVAVRVERPMIYRSRFPDVAPAFYIIATVAIYVGRGALEGVRDAVREHVREAVLRYLTRRRGKPQFVRIVDERGETLLDVEIPTDPDDD